MVKRECCFILFLLLFISANLLAQLSENVLPLAITENLEAVTSFVEMPAFDPVTEQSDDKKASRFAKMFPVDFSPENSGQWNETKHGRVWRIGLRSAHAYSIYLTLNAFFLNQGVNVFCYSPDYHQFKGAFTNRNNTVLNILSIAPLEGESIIVELNIPPGIGDYGVLHISKVYHDYRNEFGKQKTNGRVERSICDQNINCVNGKYWQTEKRAVCRIISDGGLSTGTLIGNTSGTMEPYVLTSHHTMFDDSHAAEAIFYFNYEIVSCNSDIMNDDQTVSGATLIATTDSKLDFALVKLNAIPPVSFRPYYAGWNITTTSPQRGVSIHHAIGGQKQIAIDYHPLTTGTYDQTFDPLSAWRIAAWDVGTTQPGSSGAALFDQNHRIVGTLTGGSATCYDPRNDYFSKFNMAWSNYPDAKNQLKVWLDPANKNLPFLDGYDPYGFNIDNCDTAWNVSNHQKLDISKQGLDWGWQSGHNSSYVTQYAEKFTSASSLELPGIFMNVAKAYAAKPLSSVEIKVWEGDDVPQQEIYSKTIFLKDLTPDDVNYVPFDSILKLAGNFFIGYEISYANPLDSFAVYHTRNEGTAAPSTMFVNNGTWQNVNTFYPRHQSASLALGIIECYGKVRKPLVSSVMIHPNPAINYVVVDLPGETIIYDVECFDGSGRSVPISLLAEEENKKLFFNLSTGMYLLKITTNENQFFTKLIVSKK